MVQPTLQNPPELIPITDLLLDNLNPRLATVSFNEGSREEEMISILWKEMSVDEVALSIAANGYFEEEVLFAIPQAKTGKFIVVEGNRRLAAVKLLVNDTLRAKLKVDLPKISDAAKIKLRKLPVSKYKNRKELWEYFGFRHINGPKPWDAFSKAKYVADVHEKYHIALNEIAEKIGDQNALINKLYRGYTILRQAENSGFNKDDRVKNRFYFSHLYTATDQIGFQKFLSIDPVKSLKKDPVPKPQKGALKELMTWLYGSKENNVEPLVKSQNPDLGRLRDIVSNPSSLAALRSGYSLSKAFEISLGDDRRFRESLIKAKEELQQAKGTVTTGYKGDTDLYEVLDDILMTAETIRAEMDEKRKKKK